MNPFPSLTLKWRFYLRFFTLNCVTKDHTPSPFLCDVIGNVSQVKQLFISSQAFNLFCNFSLKIKFQFLSQLAAVSRPHRHLQDQEGRGCLQPGQRDPSGRGRRSG